jgi:hypothetical protein
MDPTVKHLTSIHRFWFNKNFKAAVVQRAEKAAVVPERAKGTPLHRGCIGWCLIKHPWEIF